MYCRFDVSQYCAQENLVYCFWYNVPKRCFIFSIFFALFLLKSFTNYRWTTPCLSLCDDDDCVDDVAMDLAVDVFDCDLLCCCHLYCPLVVNILIRRLIAAGCIDFGNMDCPLDRANSAKSQIIGVKFNFDMLNVVYYAYRQETGKYWPGK